MLAQRPKAPRAPRPDESQYARPSPQAVADHLNSLEPPEREALLSACAAARDDVVWHNALVLRNETAVDEEGMPKRITMDAVHIGLLDFIQRTRRGVVLSAPRMGKSQQGTIGYPLWVIGNDISKRVVIASSVQDLAKPFIASIQKYLIESIEYAIIFPNLQVGEFWSALRADVRDAILRTTRKDPSIRGIGAQGRVTGGRVDLLLGDDMLDQLNTRTEAESDKVYLWCLNATSRITPKSGKFLFFSNPWEVYDAAHKLIEKNGWDVYRMPAADENWKPVWRAESDDSNEGWTQEAIDLYDPVVKERHLRLKARRKEDVIFHIEWLEQCRRKVDPIHHFERRDGRLIIPRGCNGAVGVDLASRTTERADWTVFVPMLAGPPAAFGIRENIQGDVSMPLWIERRRIEGPDIIAGILELWDRYGLPFVVEDNGSQRLFSQLLARTHPEIPVFNFTTDAGKKNHPDYGLKVIASEFYSKRHILPCDQQGKLHEVFVRLYEEMSLYDDRVGVHTGDCLMAFWFARSYLRGAFGMKTLAILGEALSPQDYIRAGIVPPLPAQRPNGPSTEGLSLFAKIRAQKNAATNRTLAVKNMINDIASKRGRIS